MGGSPWTETPWQRPIPLDRDPPPWTETHPLERDPPPGERPTPLDRDRSPGHRPLLDRELLGRNPCWTETPLWTEWHTGVNTLPSHNFVCGWWKKMWNWILELHKRKSIVTFHDLARCFIFHTKLREHNCEYRVEYQCKYSSLPLFKSCFWLEMFALNVLWSRFLHYANSLIVFLTVKDSWRQYNDNMVCGNMDISQIIAL